MYSRRTKSVGIDIRRDFASVVIRGLINPALQGKLPVVKVLNLTLQGSWKKFNQPRFIQAVVGIRIVGNLNGPVRIKFITHYLN